LRISSLLLVVTVLLGASFLLQTMVSTQTTYITVHGQLAFSPCTSTSGIPTACQGFFYLVTNGSTPGIPVYPTLDFSQSLYPAPSQSDVGKTVAVTGSYGQESSCGEANACSAFFVHTWGPYYGTMPPTPGPGCFTSSNPPTTWVSVQCVTAPTIPLVGGLIANSLQTNLSYIWIAISIVLIILLGYLFTHRKK
jgi:hypothetical protein